MSEVDRLRQQTYGGSASTPDSSGRSVGRYDPEVGKSIRELEKIQGREYLKLQTGVMDAEEAVLKAQVDLAEKLLDHKADLESLSQKEAEDYNDNVTKLKTELIAARGDLADKRAVWNTRAVDTARRAGSDASVAGKNPAAAAWTSVSDGLVGDQSTTVLDPQLPRTLNEIKAAFPYGVDFDSNFNLISWGSITDYTTRSSIQALLDRAQNVKLGLDDAESSFNDFERERGELETLLATPTETYGATPESRKKHYEDVTAQYNKLYNAISGVDPYEAARSKLANKADEHYAVKERSGRLDNLYDVYTGGEGTASATDKLKLGQAIQRLEQTGWRADNRPGDNVGKTFDDTGDGVVDRYIATPDDLKAILEWDTQKNRGAGKYGVKRGSTGSLVRFEVKATPQQLASIRDEDNQYYYVVGEDGQKSYLSPSEAKAVMAAAPKPAQAQAVKITINGKDYKGIRLPDGKVVAYKSGNLEEFPAVLLENATVEDVGWYSSEQTAAMQSGSPPAKADLKIATSPEPVSSPVQRTPEAPPTTFTREGEKMKIHATDQMTYPAGSIRLRGGETISADQVVGPVQLFASLTQDFGLTGAQGSYAKWKGLQAQGKVREFVSGGALSRGPIASRILGGLQFDTYGVAGRQALDSIFGRQPSAEDLPEEPVDPSAVSEEDLDEAAGLTDEAPADETRKERRSRKEEMKEQMRRSAERGELPEPFEDLPEEGPTAEDVDDVSELAPTADPVTPADLDIKDQQVPEEPMASLATDAMAKKKREEKALEKPPDTSIVGELDEIDAAAKKDARMAAIEEGRDLDKAYSEALADWKDAGPDPATKPKRPVSVVDPAPEPSVEESEEPFVPAEEPIGDVPEETPRAPLTERQKKKAARILKRGDLPVIKGEPGKPAMSDEEVRAALERIDARPKLPAGSLDIEKDFSDLDEMETAFGTTSKNPSPGLRALISFGDKINSDKTLAERMRARRAKSPTAKIDAGDEIVPSASGTPVNPDKGSTVQEEEE